VLNYLNRKQSAACLRATNPHNPSAPEGLNQTTLRALKVPNILNRRQSAASLRATNPHNPTAPQGVEPNNATSTESAQHP